MSGLITRIGRQFLNPWKIYIGLNLRHASFIEKFKHRFWNKDKKLGGTPLMSNSRHVTFEKNLTEIDHDKAEAYIRLQEFAEKTAWQHYHRSMPIWPLQRRVDFDLDWSCLKFITDTPLFQSRERKETTRVLYKTVLRNDTSREQHHTLKVEQQNPSSYKSAITTGFTTDFKHPFCIPAPSDITMEADEFSEGIILEGGTETTVEKKHTLVVEHSISIPEHTTISACIQTKEIYCEYVFEAFVTVSGSVKAIFFNQKNQSVFTCTIPLKMVVDKDCSSISTKDIEGLKAVKFAGICKFNYRIEQETTLKLQPLCTKISAKK